MRTAITTAILMTLAGQASALSCMFGDGAMAYGQASGNGDTFRAVIGTLEWADPDAAPMMQFEGQNFANAAQFSGEVLLQNGERAPISEDITVMTSCINGDCGYAGQGYEMLTFLHNAEDGTVMFAYPCQSYPIAPAEADIAAVQACLDGGPCIGAERN